ncbi:hypothetical protein FM112_11035 [Gulosibacter sp. 10]|nr:hypothetical protein FM112_11035 [Gulosibacter sp. 10]
MRRVSELAQHAPPRECSPEPRRLAFPEQHHPTEELFP